VTELQVVSVIGIPLTVLLVGVTLIAFARPDPDDGPYAAYLALASLLSIYLLLLALAATGEAIGQHLVLGDDDPFRSDLGSLNSLSVYYSLFTTGGAAAIAGFATVAAVAGGSFGFHHRRRTELLVEAPEGGTVDRIDRAYRGAVCFAMLSLALVAALVAGAAGYNFFAQPIAGGDGDRLRDLAMGSLLAYGGLVLVAGLVFRANFWAIRGNDEAPEDVTPAELGDA
jgi:hypothetical protein